MIEIISPDVSRGQRFLVLNSDIFKSYWGPSFRTNRLLFGPFSESLTDLTFLSQSCPLGCIYTSPGSSFHNCYHENVKGTIRVNLPSCDVQKSAVYWNNENVVSARYEDISDVRFFYADDVIGKRLFTSRTYSWLAEVWSISGCLSGAGGVLTVRYSHEYEPGRENDGNEWEFSFSPFQPDGTGGYISTCTKRRRSHMSGGSTPIQWGDWTDSGSEVISAWAYDVSPDVPLVGLAFAKRELEMAAAIALVDCAKGNSRADLSACFSDCADQVPLVDVNQIENVKDSLDVAGLFPWKEAFSLARNYDSPTQWVRSGSAFYLWWHYAVKPTVSDVKSLLEAKKSSVAKTPIRHRYSSDVVYRSMRTEVHGRAQTKVWCRFSIHPSMLDAMSSVLAQLDDWGLMLNTQRAWDCVPLSFVADWFLNTNSLLASVDALCRSYRYSVNYVDTTVKSTVDFTDDIMHLASYFDVQGRFIASIYDRSRNPGFPPIALRPKSDWSRHSFEGAALILANR